MKRMISIVLAMVLACLALAAAAEDPEAGWEERPIESRGMRIYGRFSLPGMPKRPIPRSF